MKKTLLITLIILLIVLGGYTMIQGYSIGTINILSYSGIKEKDNALQQKIDEVNKLVRTDYANETKSIEENKNKLTKTKEEYEDLVQVNPESGEVTRQLQQYETEYLWTKIGNHAKTEGVTLKIDITKAFEPSKPEANKQEETESNNNEESANTSENATNETDNESAEEVTEETTEETEKSKDGHYDLEFTATGPYVGIADFLYDIENDSTLGFKIEDFLIDGTDDTTGLQVVATFKCKDIAIKDLIKTSEEQREDENNNNEENDNTNSNTENTTNSTKRNTSNSSNTTNSSN